MEHRGLSTQELILRLSDKGFGWSECEQATRRLEELGILNDTALAADLVLQATRKGYGTARIAEILGQKSLPVPEGLCVPMQQELETLRVLAEKKAAGYRSLAPEAAFRRLAGYLLRRGFDADMVRRACREALGEPSGSD